MPEERAQMLSIVALATVVGLDSWLCRTSEGQILLGQKGEEETRATCVSYSTLAL